MSLSAWTVQDIVELTVKAVKLALVDTAVYCEHCGIVEVQAGDKYCNNCANEITEYLYAQYYDKLAEEYMDAIRAEKGWY